MMYNVKLSETAVNTLRRIIGTQNARINLATGIVQVVDIDELKAIAENFEVDNVNHKPYCEVVKEAELKQKTAAAESKKETAAVESTLEERKKIIGYDLEVGSIVRIKDDEKSMHVVIVAVRGQKYDVAVLQLAELDPKKRPDGEIQVLLKKGVDVVYRNTTYRDVVTLISCIAKDVEKSDFLKGAGGMIVGKVTNLTAIQPIIDVAKAYAESEETEATPSEENAVTAETETNTPVDDGKKYINFLKAIEESETVGELFQKLEVASDILMQAATECIETGRSNIKKLIPAIQSKYNDMYGRLTQAAIKNKLNLEFAEWCTAHDVDMEECSVSYFLKAIVKGLKKS